MINWVNFLHIYQPPYQETEIVQKVSKESYWPLVNVLKNNKQAKLTLSFSGCLLEQLYNIGEEKLIEEFKKLVANKQIELVGSARYHPILPLLPTNEIKRQIDLNDQILIQAFDQYYKPTGFFLPEMAYNLKVAKILKKLGYKWIILDEIAYQGRLGLVDYNKKYKIKGLGLNVIFRNRSLSKTFPPQTIIELTKKSNPPTYLVSATDGEMYGHHHQDWKNLFEQALTNPLVKASTVTEYLEALPPKPELVTLVNSSWETTPQDLKKKIPFALWQDPKNKIHQNLWELRKIAIRLINKSKEEGINYDWARHHLDRGLSSCAWWWAADRKLDIFDLLTWHPDAIEKGLKELISSIRSLKNVSQKTKLEAEKYYHLLIKEIWKKHWKKYHKMQPPETKMTPEIKRGLSLLNQNFLISLFQKKLSPQLIGNNKINYIAIKVFKEKIGKISFYHIVSRYTLYFKNKKIKPLSIFCNANSKESRQGAFLATQHLWQNGFAKGKLRCPQPLFYNKRLRAMFYVEGKGENLYQYIIEPKVKFGDLKRIVKLSAQWLARLHSLPTEGVKNFNPIQSRITTVLPGPKHFLNLIQKKHRQYPKYYQQTKELFEKIIELEKQLTPRGEKYIIHGDIHPENVVYDQEKDILNIIDYTDCCLAHFTRDLGNFYQQLGYMTRPNLPYLQSRLLQKTFIDSYLKARKIKKLTKEDQDRFNLYKAWTALRSAIFFLTITAFDRPRADALFEETKSYLKRIKL
jgi:hypothetical protein